MVEVQRMLLDGHSRGHIVRFGAEKWGLSVRQMDKYIHDAGVWIDEANLTAAERNLALVTSNQWELFRQHKTLTPGVARQALMDIAKLRGLDRADITVTVRTHKDATDDELAAALT